MGKTLYIISGCNGAGKTTASKTLLPEILHCREFVNADEIAVGLSPFKPEGMAIEAGRLMLERIAALLKDNATFSIETTLATRSYRKLIGQAQAQGYSVRLLFFWLDSPQAAIQRVAQRVSEGGHNIPTDVIVRRYNAGLANLLEIYMDVVDYWMIVDNNHNDKKYIAEGNKGGEVSVYDVDLYNKMKDYVGRGNERI